MIRKGNNISQIKGNRNTSAIAKGQQSTNRIHQRIRVSNVFMKIELASSQQIKNIANSGILISSQNRQSAT